MSKVQIEIPDDRWFRGEWDFRPQDKQLCVAIFIDRGVRILQYRKNEYGQKEILHSLSIPTYFTWDIVDRWKPLGLPAYVEERILAEIDKWFEEDSYAEHGKKDSCLGSICADKLRHAFPHL